jgi:hypothetical protein
VTEEEPERMNEMPTPTAVLAERGYTQLRQVTVKSDEEIAAVNALLADGWRVASIGQRADATVYVLGRLQEKPRRGAGFLGAE